MYVLRGNSIKNEQRRENNARELHLLKQKYGENWEAGVDKDPTVARHGSREIYEARRRHQEMKRQEKEKNFCKSFKDSVLEINSRGKMSGRQTERYLRAADLT